MLENEKSLNMKKKIVNEFIDTVWSTKSVKETHQQKVIGKIAEISVIFAVSWYDIDTCHDLRQFWREGEYIR